MKYAYQRGGAPLIQWSGRNSAPSQTRAPSGSLGSLGDASMTSLHERTLVLPAPGAPEAMNGTDCGCGCKGHGGCGGAAMGHDGIGDIITDALANPVIVAIGAWAAYYLFTKKKKR